MDYANVAKKILQRVGGKENVISLVPVSYTHLTELTETEAAQDTGAETETGAEDGADMEETSAGAEGSTDMPEADTVDEQAEATELVVQLSLIHI